MSAADSIRVRQGEKLYGPFSRQQILDLVASGRFSDGALVSIGEGPWQPIGVLTRPSPPPILTPEPPPPDVPLALEELVPVTPLPPGEAPAVPAAPLGPPPRLPTALPVGEPATPVPATVYTAPPPVGNPMAMAIIMLGFGFLLVILVSVVLVVLQMRSGSTGPVASVPPPQPAAALPAEAKPRPVPSQPAARPLEPEPAVEPLAPPPAPPPKARKAKPAHRPEDAIAAVCFVEENEGKQKEYLPFMTAWAVDRRHLVTRAARLLAVNADELIGGARLHVLTPAGPIEVVGLRYHPRFPADKFGTGQATERDLQDMVFYDVALLETAADMPAQLEIAADPGLARTAGLATTLLAADCTGDPVPLAHRPQIRRTPVSLTVHEAVGKPHRDLAAIRAAFRLPMDGCPVLDAQNRAIGLVALVADEQGLRDVPHFVLSTRRVKELLEKP